MADGNGAFPDLQTVARALGGEVSNGQVLAPGPDHSAIDRSLSVKPEPSAPDGFIVHSFASDDPITCKDYVRKKLGLPAFKPNSNDDDRQQGIDNVISRAVMAAALGQNRARAKIVATYDYRDDDGTLLYQVLRHEPKNFSQRRPDGNGGWISKLDERRVVYRWPDVLKFPEATIFVCEGEKDADRVAQLNLCATTVAAGIWTSGCVNALSDRDIIILQDNDRAGRDRALEAAQALHAVVDSIRIVALPDLPEKGDVSDWLDADARRAEKFCDVCFNAPLWTPLQVTNTETRTDTKAEGNTERLEDKPERPAFSFLKISDWKDRPVPERPWTVKDRIPASNVTLLSGEGSVGKSILSLQLAVAVVLGKDWLGSLPEYGPAMVICCEDDADEIWRRLDLIFTHYGASYTDFDDLHVRPLVNGETLMAVPNRTGIITLTKLFELVREAACDIRPKLLVLDNAADVYGGNENDRAQVRQFINHLRTGLAIPSGAGVLLTSHPSLTGITSGSGLSGSTAWNASVRSRLYFRRAVTEKDEEPDPDLRVLEVMKSNYGPAGEIINLRWSKGLFVPIGGISALERAAAEQEASQLFLTLLDQFNREGNNVSAKRTSRNYAPTQFAREKQAKEAHIKKADFEQAMRRMLDAGKIKIEDYGPPSHRASKLVTA